MKRLEYIESTGTQWIDTGILFNGLDTALELKFQIVEKPTNGKSIGIIGSWDGSNNFRIYYNTNLNIYRFQYKSGAYDTSKNVDTNINKIDYKKGILKINDIQRINFTPSNFTNPRTAYLFFTHSGSPEWENNGKLRVYYCKIFNNDELVRYFIPVEDDDGVACMLDLVSGNYFYNKGTGTFTKGPKLDIYTPIEYIENTGSQYIDTGIYPNQVTKWKFDITYVGPHTQNGYFGGGYYSMATTTNKYYAPLIINKADYRVRYGYANTWANTNTYLQLNTRYECEAILVPGQQKLIMNNTIIYDATSNADIPNAQVSIPIFCYQYQSSRLTAYGPKVRLHSLKLYGANDELLRDYIPVLDKDDVPCLYDLVTNTYFYNQGSGSFIGGGFMPRAFADTAGLQQIANNIRTALNTKQNALTEGSNITIASDGTISATDTTYSEATTSASGLMSSTDKTKLNGVASGAEVNVITGIKVNGTSQTPTNKVVDISVPDMEAITNSEIDALFT